MEYTVIEFATVTSTNDVAKEYAKRGACQGTIIKAVSQTKGRGRLGRTWYSPEGGLWFSLILRPEGTDPTDGLCIPLAAGLAVCDMLSCWGLEPVCKWPNDVLVRESKVCGILAETCADALILGVGLNLRVDGAPEGMRYASIHRLAADVLSPDEALQYFMRHFSPYYHLLVTGQRRKVLEYYKKYDALSGREVQVVTFERQINGIARGIGPCGELLVETAGTVHHIYSGDVERCRVMHARS